MELSYRADQSQNQKQRQRQNLILTLRMRESLEILQMSLPELQEKIDKEILENPVLEFGGQDGESQSEKEINGKKTTEAQNLFPEFLKQNSGLGTAGSPDDRKNDSDRFAAVSQEPTFRDYLMKQLSELDVEPAAAKICRYLIDNLDEKGYLRYSAEEIAADLNIRKIDMVDEAIAVIRQMDPAGVGASDLRECLALQVERMPGTNPAVTTIIDRYLGLLSGNRVREIARELDIPAVDAQKCCNVIRNLNPIPSSGFNTETREQFVMPEATVKIDECGNLYIESSRDDAKRLYINRDYVRMAESTDDSEVRVYLQSKLRRASVLMSNLSNRKKTVLRVIETVVQCQPLYFKKGRSFLKPMTMKSVAEQLDLNESTISRAIQNKFILCPLGIVSLKSLFTCPVNARPDNSAASSAEVKEKIKEIIKTEDKTRPLSDQRIMAELGKSDFAISRRTVAKYRDELGILSAAGRKTYQEE